MAEAAQSAEIARLQRERVLLLRLLDLGRQAEPEPFLREALPLLVEVSGARQGYLELYDEESSTEPRWWIAHGFSAEEVERVRANISRGIIAEALASGEVITTPSALLDPRFSSRESVHAAHIEAVLCAPIGADPPRGVLYLQGPAGCGVAAEEDRARAELFAFHLAPLVDRLLERRRTEEVSDPTRSLRASLRLESVIGRSPALAAVLRQAALVAPLDVSVLLTGESGTGKSQLARIIHDNSPRAGQPFVHLNCAALPEALLESELFGAVQGAHSTATRRIEGKVSAAERGTLFLDEIGELPSGAQAKLLELLQSKQYYPLGSSKLEHADVRLIAATNTDLRQAVGERRFREDLYYRLQVLPIRMPSLTERREDIAELALSFCHRASERHRLPRLGISRNAIRALEAAEWPGNIRELENAIEAATIRAAPSGSKQIECGHLFETDAAKENVAETQTFQEATRQFQARLLRDTLEDTGWNVIETAHRLDLARSHVYNLIRAFGLERQRA